MLLYASVKHSNHTAYSSQAPGFTPCFLVGSILLIFLIFCVVFIYRVCLISVLYGRCCLYLKFAHYWLHFRFSLSAVSQVRPLLIAPWVFSNIYFNIVFHELHLETKVDTRIMHFIHTVYVETLSSVCLFRQLNQSTSAPTVCFVVHFY